MITGCLQQKNGFYYAVLYLKVNGRRRCKWVPMRLPVEGTSARKAKKAFPWRLLKKRRFCDTIIAISRAFAEATEKPGGNKNEQ